MDAFKTLLSLATNHLVLAFAGFFAALTAAALNVTRRQIRLFVNWSMRPIVQQLPWNAHENTGERTRRKPYPLIARLTLIDIFLIDPEGQLARYQKTTNFLVRMLELHAYDEAVTCTGAIRSVSTLLGEIVQTRREHGFSIYRIDL